MSKRKVSRSIWRKPYSVIRFSNIPRRKPKSKWANFEVVPNLKIAKSKNSQIKKYHNKKMPKKRAKLKNAKSKNSLIKKCQNKKRLIACLLKKTAQL